MNATAPGRDEESGAVCDDVRGAAPGPQVTSLAIGSGALLRLAALPVETWLCAGAPMLFEELRSLDRRASMFQRRARAAGVDLGNRVVPHPDLEPTDRAAVLAVRRSLHRGSAPRANAVAAALLVIGKLLPGDRLTRRLRDLSAEGAALEQTRGDIERLARDEELRLLAAPWPLLLGHPAGRQVVRASDLAVCADIAARVGEGEPWTTKRMRQRSDYLWRILRRASTRATPRGWLAHVMPLIVREDDAWTGTGELRVDSAVASDHNENLDRRRTSGMTAEALRTDESLCVGVAPLATMTATHLVVWTLDGEHRRRLGELRLRRTPMLAAILAALADGARAVPDVLDALAGPDESARAHMADLLHHLSRVGAVQVAAAPRRTLITWQPIEVAPTFAESAAAGRSSWTGASEPDGYVDVYRRTSSGLSTRYAQRLAALIGLAQRVMALIDDDRHEPSPLPDAIGEHPRALLEVAADCMSAGVDVRRGRPHHHDWPRVADFNGGYARLWRWISAHLDTGEPDRPIDIDSSILEELNAPAASSRWPVDCLLRPLRDPAAVAVLDQIVPAGVLDARFAPALADLGQEPSQTTAYRQFLECFSARTGRALVELLVPPLSAQAANAVRRPGYTPLWTGDPDRAGYIDGGPGQYVPLAGITLRRSAGHVVVEAAGQPIWPVLHTARLMSPPWDTISALLLLGSPQPERERWRSLRYSLPAWPRRQSLPRITVGGELVLTPAQWRVRPADLWSTGDPLTTKLAGLERLRRRRRLPRLVSVSTDVHRDPIAVDLASLPGLRALDRFIQKGSPTLLVRELLAEPDRLPVTDDGSGGRACLAELLLRLPVATPAELLAHQVADRWAPRLTARMAVAP